MSLEKTAPRRLSLHATHSRCGDIWTMDHKGLLVPEDEQDDGDDDDDDEARNQEKREDQELLPSCPVEIDDLVDGLLEARNWFDAAYADICEHLEIDLYTRHELALLRMIARYAKEMRAPRPTELAKALGVSKGYVVQLSRRLVEDGLVEKTRSRGDGRVRALDLTKEGELMATVTDVGLAFWSLINEELGPQAAHDLARALVALRRMPRFW